MTESTEQTTTRRRQAINHLLMSDPAIVCATVKAITESDREAGMILITNESYSELLSNTAKTITDDEVTGD